MLSALSSMQNSFIGNNLGSFGVHNYSPMDPRLQMKNISSTMQSSSRILYDIPCKVCQDHSSGKHYGIFACDGCAGFFKRSIRRNRQYICKAKVEGTCVVDKTHRNQCRACRLTKCKDAGMNSDAVQHERGPRNSTLRRQMALFFKDPSELSSRFPMMPPVDLSYSTSPIPPAPSILPPHPLLCSGSSLNNLTNIPRYPMPHPSPPSLPQLQSPETVCESAARLLFMNVKWAKSVPAFTSLPLSDQLLLLEESWRDLFVLGAAQFLIPLELGQLFHACGALTREANPVKTITLLQEVKAFQDTLTKITELCIDPHEYACLRAIVLFKRSFEQEELDSSDEQTMEEVDVTDDRPDFKDERKEENADSQDSTRDNRNDSNDDHPSSSSSYRSRCRSLCESVVVTRLHDQTQLMLNKYISTAHPSQPLRFGKLLLLIPTLRSVSCNTIEELFFRKTIGNIPIERIICDMYKTSDV